MLKINVQLLKTIYDSCTLYNEKKGKNLEYYDLLLNLICFQTL